MKLKSSSVDKRVKSKSTKERKQTKTKSKKVPELVEDEFEGEPSPVAVKKKKKSGKEKVGKLQKSKKLVKDDPKEETSDEEAVDHESGVKNLKNIDPEFYSFLKKNDKELLKFNAEDLYNVESKEEDQRQEDSDEEVHQPGDLHNASDESDAEEDDDGGDSDGEGSSSGPKTSNTVTLKMLKELQGDLGHKKVSLETIKKCVHLFNSALLSISPDAKSVSQYVVNGSGVFNGVLQLTLLHLKPAVWQFLGIATRKTVTDVHKLKKWKRVRNTMRLYVQDLTKILENITSSNILVILLKHLHQMIPVVIAVSGASKPVLKRLVSLWSTAPEETVRVLSFLCILKLTRSQQPQFLNQVLKVMYLSYVRNSKFVSPATLPGINFMRRSLTEMFTLDMNVAYQHAFLYIRQLAIHLRNAVTLKKRESYQTVYNWQFVNSLKLWCDVLVATYNKPNLHPLIYPLVTIAHGVIKLIPTAQWFPLRFHCITALSSLSKQTGVFVTVLPFILEVLNSTTFNKKHTELSMKGMSFTCMLRATKPQLEELSFRNEVVDQIYACLLDYLAHESYSLSFPDLVVPCVLTLKQYLKTCKVANTSRKLKQLCDLIVESAKVIERERKSITFTLKDQQLVASWEAKMRNKGTPLLTFYSNWLKTNELKKKREAVRSDDINDYDLPTVLKRPARSGEKRVAMDDDGNPELFPSDDEDYSGGDSEEDAIMEKLNGGPSEKKNAKKVNGREVAAPPPAKKAKKVAAVTATEEDFAVDNNVDIIEDLNIDDWDD